MIVELQHLPPKLQSRIEHELRANEELVWTGRPMPWVLARSGVPTMIYAIPFLAVAIFITYKSLYMGSAMGLPSASPPLIFLIVGFGFILIGAVMTLAPLWKWLAANSTCYALTTRRAIVFEAGFNSTTIRSYGPGDFDKLSRRERSSGTGDLVFEEVDATSRLNEGSPSKSRRGFLAIRDVAAIERLLRETLLPN